MGVFSGFLTFLGIAASPVLVQVAVIAAIILVSIIALTLTLTLIGVGIYKFQMERVSIRKKAAKAKKSNEDEQDSEADLEMSTSVRTSPPAVAPALASAPGAAPSQATPAFKKIADKIAGAKQKVPKAKAPEEVYLDSLEQELYSKVSLEAITELEPTEGQQGELSSAKQQYMDAAAVFYRIKQADGLGSTRDYQIAQYLMLQAKRDYWHTVSSLGPQTSFAGASILMARAEGTQVYDELAVVRKSLKSAIASEVSQADIQLSEPELAELRASARSNLPSLLEEEDDNRKREVQRTFSQEVRDFEKSMAERQTKALTECSSEVRQEFTAELETIVEDALGVAGLEALDEDDRQADKTTLERMKQTYMEGAALCAQMSNTDEHSTRAFKLAQYSMLSDKSAYLKKVDWLEGFRRGNREVINNTCKLIDAQCSALKKELLAEKQPKAVQPEGSELGAKEETEFNRLVQEHKQMKREQQVEAQFTQEIEAFKEQHMPKKGRASLSV